MARVFISYSQSDRERADAIAQRLMRDGAELWWDAGKQRDLRRVDEELARAEQVVVLWSPKSVGATSVLDQADYAREENKLAQVFLDDVRLPPRFRSLPGVRLTDADLENNADWAAFLAAMTGKAAPERPAAAKPKLVSLHRLSGPAVTTALMSISSVAAAAPSTQFLFPGEQAGRVLSQIANVAPALSGIAALMVLQQMWSRARGV